MIPSTNHNKRDTHFLEVGGGGADVEGGESVPQPPQPHFKDAPLDHTDHIAPPPGVSTPSAITIR